MKVLGIVAEYNPFHNGHLYHLEKSLEVTGSTHSVAIMSGNFVQRGEPSLVNKWARAEMAVNSGIDLVIELPVVYSCRSAEAFALGAISILDKTGAIDCICFGSESGDLSLLQHLAEILSEEPEEYKSRLKHYLGKGLSFPAARERALEGEMPSAFIDNTLFSPNNILALEYLKAIYLLESPITPYTVKRIISHYDSTGISGSIASATAIRKEILSAKGISGKLARVIPSGTRAILDRELACGRGPVLDDQFSPMLIGRLRMSKPAHLKYYPDVSEGLENKIWQAARDNVSISRMLKGIKSKRYTLTRLKRIAVYMLLNIHRDMLTALQAVGFPGYVRVLAFNHRGREILRRMNAFSRIPVITKAAHHSLSENTLQMDMFEKDLVATDIYVMAYSNQSCAYAGQDFVTTPFYLQG